jgi:hypothetical protein
MLKQVSAVRCGWQRIANARKKALADGIPVEAGKGDGLMFSRNRKRPPASAGGTARLVADHNLTHAVVHAAIGRIAEAIRRVHSTHDDALFNIGKDLGTASDGGYLNAPHPRVLALADAIAAELRHPDWLKKRTTAEPHAASTTALPENSTEATMPDLPAYDPSAFPEWARESIAHIAREHPDYLSCHLAWVAEIEAAKRRTAEHPPLPAEPRDLLRLAAVEAWQSLASGRPAPVPDPVLLYQVMDDVFTTGNGISPVEQLIEDWYELARQCGITEHGDFRPGIDAAITRAVTAAIWFGITTGYLTLTGSYHIPRRYLAGV